jgi:ATP-dependent RNA helicase DeaD
MKFSDFNLNENIQKAISDLGFSIPTEIQSIAIPKLLDTNNDFVGQAQTGTGKTIAFVVPILEKLNAKSFDIQALILTPTRELANQVEKEIVKLGKYSDIRSQCVYGGTEYEPQIDAIRKGNPHIIVGTPGRVIDLIKKKIIKLDKAKFCVLDEADEMLTMGFVEDVQIALDQFNGNRQLMMFSATMPKAILKLIDKSFKNAIIEKVENVSVSNDAITQEYFVVREKHMREALSRLIDSTDNLYAIVFCRTKIETKEVGDDLKKRGYSVDVLNGDMGQAERDHAMNGFKKKKVNILVCTDVAARGIDVDSLTHVFNYGLPRDNESYVHRIGRTGRAGMSGVAYTIIGPNHENSIRSLEDHTGRNIKKSQLPTVDTLKFKIVTKETIQAKQIYEAIARKGDEFKTEVGFELLEESFGELSKEELLKLMFVWKFNKEMRHLNNLADIETFVVKKKKPKKKPHAKTQSKSTGIRK